MIDTYLKSKNREALDALRGFVKNMTPIAQGQAQSTLNTADGQTIAVGAKGDPEYWYACVRAPFPLPAFGEVEVCAPEEAIPIVGVWA